MKSIFVQSTVEEKDVLKEQSTWRVVISDSFVSHEYRFRASSHLSIAVMYGLFMAVLRMAGYKK